MKFNFKNLVITGAIATGIVIPVTAVNAEIQCPMGWVKKVENSVVVCVAQDQNQNQAQAQTNIQTQNVNQNVAATGGSSSSSSSSSSNTYVAVTNSAPVAAPQVVYQVPTTVKTLPATGLPEAAMALSALVPAGFALKKFAFKKSATSEESASSVWLEKNS